jgi:hypothetical protein
MLEPGDEIAHGRQSKKRAQRSEEEDTDMISNHFALERTESDAP